MARSRRYIGRKCGSNDLYPLIDTSDYLYKVGDVVKNANNDCFTIISVDDGGGNFNKAYEDSTEFILLNYGETPQNIISKYRDCDECNGIYTISYSGDNNGWTSFWSYKPDWMIYLNNSFYTFKGQSLYKHNVNNTRNNFYGTQYTSQLTLLANQSPNEIKVYNTLELDSTSAWDTYLKTDLSQGVIDSTYYVNKEGEYFAYIRREDNGDYDLKSMATQGIGELFLVSFPVANTLTFAFNISASLNINDKVYRVNGSTIQYVGTISSYTSTTITLSSASAISLAQGDYIMVAKNQQAESYGLRGYYMEIELENSDTDYTEIFGVKSKVFKSYGD